MFTMSEYLYMLFYLSLKCIYSFHIKYLVSAKLSNIYTALWMSTYCKTVYMSHFDNGCRTSFCYFYSVFSICFVHVELQIIWRNQVFIFYINILAEFLGFIAVKWTLNGSCFVTLALQVYSWLSFPPFSPLCSSSVSGTWHFTLW